MFGEIKGGKAEGRNGRNASTCLTQPCATAQQPAERQKGRRAEGRNGAEEEEMLGMLKKGD